MKLPDKVHTRTRQLLLLLTIFPPLHLLVAQNPCETDSLYHVLDFWVGDWEVRNQSDQIVGTNRIEKILSGCAVMEHWTNSGGREGKSLFYVDNNTRNWKQVWVTENSKQPGGQKEKVLLHHSMDSTALFQGWYFAGDQRVLDRTLLEKIDMNTVRQTIQVSRDGGQSWQTGFIGLYLRR